MDKKDIVQPKSTRKRKDVVNGTEYFILNNFINILSMFLRLIFSILLIALITPQTLVANSLLRKLSNSQLFVNYGEAKTFLNITTWTIAFLYLLLTQI